VVLGGVFTEGSLNQLRSHVFTVLYFPYESIIAAFGSVGIDARFDEDTPDSVLRKKVGQYGKLKAAQQERIAARLRHDHQADIDDFVSSLRITLTRKIEAVYVLPLHGTAQTLGNISEAIAFIESFDESKPAALFIRYEVGVRYSNGDEIRGQFKDKTTTVAFLRGL